MDTTVQVPDQFSGAFDLIAGVGADFFSVIVVVALVAIFALYFGGDRLVPLLAGLYVAIPLYTFFAYKEAVGDNPYLLIGLYVLFVTLSVIAFSGLSYFTGGGAVGFFKIGGLSLLTAGLILAIAIHVLPFDSVYDFSDPTRALFQSDQAFFWWLLAPLAALFLLGRS